MGSQTPAIIIVIVMLAIVIVGGTVNIYNTWQDKQYDKLHKERYGRLHSPGRSSFSSGGGNYHSSCGSSSCGGGGD
jgi:hypothetical protein